MLSGSPPARCQAARAESMRRALPTSAEDCFIVVIDQGLNAANRGSNASPTERQEWVPLRTVASNGHDGESQAERRANEKARSDSVVRNAPLDNDDARAINCSR